MLLLLLFVPISLPFLAFFFCRFSFVASSVPLHCYSCSTIDAVRLMAEVHDPNWHNWLEQVRTVPRTAKCADPFETVSALRHGVRSQLCSDGICLKLWFRDHQKGGDGHVWRWCAKNAEGRLRADCTHIKSSKGELEVCTCEGNLCNGSAKTAQNTAAMLFFPSVATIAFFIL
ncbi:hypothetical protein niasHS_007503 [Heterodera schachtii]|uniref:UPAR/Ly6 domain-containing protein qvr n=1 Tax=Heterodera schachtii TaxID=97005 RepID=A0ABD2JXU5_HETSC